MKKYTVRALAMLVIVAVFGVGFWESRGYQYWGTAAWAAGGTVFPTTVATVSTAILPANPLRKTLLCENIGTTNPIFLTFGQTATASNGFILTGTATTASAVTGPSFLDLPRNGCQGQGCVPLGAINAITTGGTSAIVCWED